MSGRCSLSESSSGCSCAAPAGYFSLGLREAFPFSAQPLVYYAGVPDAYSERQKGHDKSDKPNYFVKAFRWYTQEHGTTKSTAGETKDVGFATWLDHKYQQYLCDSQLKDASFKSEEYVHSPRTNQEQATHKSAKSKGFQRVLRSPWRKRRAAAKSPKGGNTCTECNSSWQILLRPKSLSHLESDNCAKKQSTTRASSRATVTSSDTQMAVRTYSRRLGTVVQEVTDLDVDNSIKENTKKIDTLDSQNTYVLDKNCTEVTNSKIKVKCECPVEPNQTGQSYKTDASTQYDPDKNIVVNPLYNVDTPRGTSKLDCCKSTESPCVIQIFSPHESEENTPELSKTSNNQGRARSIKNTCPTVPKDKHIKIDAGDKTNQKSSCACEVHMPVLCHQCHLTCKNIDNNRKQVIQNVQDCQRSPCSHMSSANGSAQTSDYAIKLGNLACGLPLLLRIVSPRQ